MDMGLQYRGAGGGSRRGGKRRRSRGKRPRAYPLGLFAGKYLLALLLVGLVCAISPGLGIFSYLACGHYLNRTILQRMYWHKYTVTLSDVAHAKLWMLLLWPVAYARLLIQIGLAQWL